MDFCHSVRKCRLTLFPLQMSSYSAFETKCKLCHQIATLCISHIIPKFAYKQSGLIGDKRKFDVHCFSDRSKSELHKQDGFKEYLLCESCERRLNQWETYASKSLFDGSSPAIRRINGDCILGGLNYVSLKLFTTSIIWRMSVSQHGFFSMVQLPSRHEEAMRQMLLHENPREHWRYGCNISMLTHCGKPIAGIFSQPKPYSVGKGRLCYRFLFSGMLWNIYVSNTPQCALNVRTSLQPNGDWILFSGEFTQHPDLAKERELLINHHLLEDLTGSSFTK